MVSKVDVKRHLILDTAKQIILESGLSTLTLDAVAKQAGISKGGLLYHYPSKEALIKGLATSIFDEFTARFYQYAENDPNETGRWSRALIAATKIDLEDNSELNAGFMATSYLDANIAKNISEGYASILKKIEDDKINPITATIIRLALDGLCYSQKFNISPLDKERENEVIQKLVELTKREGQL
ncbi:TetR family transcriptional regulator [Peribacillus loiseleuriae]|uniref:TetR/AcrR family transcriptional regulator n=1 Tax=Peribacillus loiseleuriae TaxID=1679170 RepID=UPI00380AF756